MYYCFCERCVHIQAVSAHLFPVSLLCVCTQTQHKHNTGCVIWYCYEYLVYSSRKNKNTKKLQGQKKQEKRGKQQHTYRIARCSDRLQVYRFTAVQYKECIPLLLLSLPLALLSPLGNPRPNTLEYARAPLWRIELLTGMYHHAAAAIKYFE